MEEITQLLGEERSTALLEGFISKRNRPFSATLKLSEAGRIEWDFPPRSAKSGGAVASREFPVNPQPVSKCPYHPDSDVVETPTNFACKEDGCKLSVPREICKRELTRDEAAQLFKDNTTEALESYRRGFVDLPGYSRHGARHADARTSRA